MSEINEIIRLPTERTEEEKKKRKKWIIIILIGILFILTTLLVLYKLGYIGAKDPLADAGVIIGAGVKEGKPDTGSGEKDPAEGSNGKEAMSISLNGYPVFADGRSSGNLNIVNSERNELYMKVEIRLKDTDEVIYESGGIPPNHYIDNDKLTIVLQKGEYEAVAHVTLYDPDTPDAKFNSSNFNLIITIEN